MSFCVYCCCCCCCPVFCYICCVLCCISILLCAMLVFVCAFCCSSLVVLWNFASCENIELARSTKNAMYIALKVLGNFCFSPTISVQFVPISHSFKDVCTRHCVCGSLFLWIQYSSDIMYTLKKRIFDTISGIRPLWNKMNHQNKSHQNRRPFLLVFSILLLLVLDSLTTTNDALNQKSISQFQFIDFSLFSFPSWFQSHFSEKNSSL